MSLLCRRPSSSSMRDRREVATTALCRLVSTFARPVRILDPARGSSFRLCAIAASSSSMGNCGRAWPRRSVTMGMSSTGGACETPRTLVSRAWAQSLDRVYASSCMTC